jgi:hypothetical protein
MSCPRYISGMKSSANLDTSKLFHVLVVGGMSMAVPVVGCGSTTNPPDDGGLGDSAADQSTGKDSGAADTGTVQDTGASDGPCLNTPGDCTHGLCSW